MSMSITIYPPSISIHAPRTGSDDERGGIAGEVDFNPRSPHGERHTFRCWLLRLGIFQSTLPARGATRAAQHQQKCNLISIHAPRTGSDCSGKSAHLPCCDFNPRSPHGERRTRFICSLPTQTISIHAPRTGSDQSQQPVELRLSYFNPRSPHGERHVLWCRLVIRQDFNPRSPHGERLQRDYHGALDIVFQSTLPARGATVRHNTGLHSQGISIHAPRTGSDEDSAANLYQRIKFQSTLPARGATIRRRNESVCKMHFNPRSPHGERRNLRRDGSTLIAHFNPRSPHGERRRALEELKEA